MEVTLFKDLVRERCGLSFDEVRMATLADSLQARMAERGIESSVQYLDCLINDQDEFHTLVNLLTVNETYFFREPAHLELLAKRIVPRLLAGKRPGERIRIMSAGCSTGEEPYSLVIALMEHYGVALQHFLAVIGADIDSDAIAKAKKGVYKNHSFRGFPDSLKSKYFEPVEGNRFRIRKCIRERVEFRTLNLLSDAYPEEVRGMDVVFYRNVSIYFEPETQKNIFRKLADLLNENGCLFVSSTETLSHTIGVLPLVEIEGVFLYRKSTGDPLEGTRRSRRSRELEPPEREQPLQPLSSPRPPSAVPKESVPRGTKGAGGRGDVSILFEQALSLAHEKRYGEALRHVEILIAQEPSLLKAYLLKAGILINLKRLDEAESACLQGRERDRWCLEAFLLRGVIAKLRNDEEDALKRFKEALYIQSSCWLAHFCLAEIHRSRGETDRACREYEIVVKLLERGNLNDPGFTFFPLSFSVEQIAHLCRHHLSKLKKAE